MAANRRTRGLLALLAAALALNVLPVVHAGGSPSDPHRDKQWALDRIEAEGAWRVATGHGVRIAIVDSGVDLGHPDLAPKLVDYRGLDVVDRARCRREPEYCVKDGPADLNGHGTHVAGIAAGIAGNAIGIAGVAPDATIIPVRVLDSVGRGTTRGVARGIVMAANRGADVINLSLGLTSGADRALRVAGRLDPIYEAIDFALNLGAVVVVAAGNDTFPLCAEPSAHPRVLCVGATDRHDVRSWYSNSDATMSARYLVAPGGRGLECGTDVYSTYLRVVTPSCGNANGYTALAGTSMAAPHVSGVVALLLGEGLSPHEARRCVIDTTDDLGVPGRDPLYGYGLLNARRAVSGCPPKIG